MSQVSLLLRASLAADVEFLKKSDHYYGVCNAALKHQFFKTPVAILAFLPKKILTLDKIFIVYAVKTIPLQATYKKKLLVQLFQYK